jgi:ornithine cyclodeaminase/alanine dehydrogenase-like protein (mu-crystallin family)
MLILNHDDVFRALSPEDCAAAVREVLVAQVRGETHMPLRTIVSPPGAAGMMGLMPAWRQTGPARPAAFSLKVVCLMPSNPERGLDAHQGLVALFDGENGFAQAILDTSAVTAIRTAAVTAIATDVLARPDAKVLAILGAGVQARSHLRAMLGGREYEEVRCYAPTREHVQAVIESIDGDGPPVRACGSAEEAVRGADVVVTVTSSRRPVLERGWLGPGAHLNAVGASQPAALEIDARTFADAAVFADSRESVLSEAGEYQAAVRDGLISGEDHVRAELGEVLAGVALGRREPGELTLFRSLGLAIEDLAAARCAVREARRLGIGQEVQW